MLLQLCKSVGWINISGGLLGFVFTNSLYSGVFAMVGGLILVPIVSLLTPKSRPADVENMFAGYNRETVSTARRSLGGK